MLPHLPRDRNHGLSGKRRHHRERPGHRLPRVTENNKALRPDRRHDSARRDRADSDLTPQARGMPLMADVVIENPILNSPFREPTRHFKFTSDGITNEVAEGRRTSSYFIPIAQPRKKGKQL